MNQDVEQRVAPKRALRQPSRADDAPVRIADRYRQAQALARVVEQQVLQEWTEHVGEKDMARLQQILDRRRKITDPYAKDSSTGRGDQL